MAEGNAQEKHQEGVPIKRYVTVLFRYKYFIGITFVVGTVLGIVGAILFVRDMNVYVYDGSKVILVQSPQTQLHNLLEENPNRQDDPFLDATLAQLRDESVLRVVAQRCKLDDAEKSFAAEAEQSAGGRLFAWVKKRLSFQFAPGGSESTFLDAATRELGKNLGVEFSGIRGARPATGSSFPVTVTYFNSDPDKVAEVINTFIEVLRERRSAEFESSEFAKKQEELFMRRHLDLETVYVAAAKKLKQVYEELGLHFDSDVNVDLTFLQHRELQFEIRIGQLVTDIAQRRAQIGQLEVNLKALQEYDGGMIPTAAQVESLEARAVASELQDIESIRQELRRRLWSTQTSESERIQVSAGIEQLENRWETTFAKFRAMRKMSMLRSPETIRVEQEIAVRKVELETFEEVLTAMEDTRGKQRIVESVRRAKIAELSGLRVEYHRIVARYEAAKVQAEERKIYSEARGQVDHIKDVTSVVQLSELPRAFTKFRRRNVVLAAAFSSLAAALGIAFMLGVALDSSLQNPSDTERTLGLPVLSAIPEIRHGLFR